METEFVHVDSRARTAGRKGWKGGRLGAVATVLAGLFLLAVIAAGTAQASDAVGPQAVSRISVMSLGRFTFDGGGSVSFADTIACTSTNGCAGVFGFNFPQFSLFVQVTGGYACSPSGSPTTCAISFTGGEALACTLTAYLPAAPGDGNPVDLACSSPSGTGHGLSTLTVLM